MDLESQSTYNQYVHAPALQHFFPEGQIVNLPVGCNLVHSRSINNLSKLCR